MQIAALFLMLLAWLGPTGALASASSCPDRSLGETAQDCPWAGIARSWPVSLKKSAPDLYRQVESDSAHEGLKGLWGESSNFDELAKATIVDPRILETLAKIMKAPAVADAPAGAPGGTVFFAGLEHTYGYLFSTLKTEFGFKRERWVSGQIEASFGLRKGLLGPGAPKAGGGTFFSNVTYFFGRIAFRDDTDRLGDLERDSASVAGAIKSFDYGSLHPARLEEIIPSERVLIHTDLIPFPKDPQHELLVYSIVRKSQAKLITGFPVTKEYANSLLDPDGAGGGLGDNRPIVTRYNAYVAGISGKGFTGTRRVVTVQYIDWRKRHVRH